MTARALGLGALSAALVIGLSLAGALEGPELGLLDRLFEWRGPRPPAAPIVIVAIDEDSFDELDLTWPFPRALHGRLLDAIAAGEPLVIGLDVLFPEPSPRGPGDDAALGAAVARARPVVLAAAHTRVAENVGELVLTREDLNLPVPAVRRGAAAVAPVNLLRDRDARVRRVPYRLRAGEHPVPGFDAELHRLAGERGLPVAPWPAGGSEVLINYRGGPGTFPWVPYHRVVRGEVPPETFRGAIVLIGPTSPVLHDVFPTPFAGAGNMPGVEIHAHALDTLVRGDAIRPVSPALPPTLAAVAALGAALAVARLRALRALATVAVLAALLAGATYGLFAAANVWLPALGPGLALVLAYTLAVGDAFVREQRQRRRLSRFFSPAVLDEIARQRGEAVLGSARREITVLFADLRGFTSLAERLDPEQVAQMLGEYLTEMTEAVFRHGGTVDKYIGDAIMALYNAPLPAPDHAARAVRTALEFQRRTRALSARWQARLGVELRSGVGIHTGEAVVGTLGSRQRLEYTAVGDTVN
ncbi:MAG: adenylate/guanylate cyclase domain-containing protein, partial [Candidatus Rokubacteria bacterium]|nr:adenylate/guanylate cyclase domain-containing protein [Candidatus Rokubacteria bacterium]